MVIVENIDGPMNNDKVKVWIDEYGIFHQVYLEAVELDINDVKKEFIDFYELTNGKATPILVDITHVNSITREAREFIVNEGRNENIIATAVLVKSLVGKIIANFVHGLNQSKVSVRLFSSEDKALEWLRGFT